MYPSSTRFNALQHSRYYLIIIATLLVSACATESHRSIDSRVEASPQTNYSGPKSTLAVGNFQNRSTYMNGIFASGDNRLGNQAKTILISNLQKTNRFTVVDRQNMKMLEQESAYTNSVQNIKGANYVVTGDVSEFGRKVIGDHQLFGILGSAKKQIAYAKVTLNIVDVRSSAVIYSTTGAGEYQLGNREIIGFGGTAGYDSTLNGKVLNLAIVEAVNNLVAGIETSGIIQ